MPKHIHADLMKQYAEDAMTTDEPWKFWEVFSRYDGTWVSMDDSPAWNINVKYRRKEKYKVKFNDNLNDAGWDFNSTCINHDIQVSPAMFNNVKSILKEVIEGYLERMSKEEVEKLLRAK